MTENDVLVIRLASALFDVENTARLQEHPEELPEYQRRAYALIGMLALNGLKLEVRAMSVDRHGSTVRFVCDDCGVEADTFGSSFSDALEMIKNDGWELRPIYNGSWEHYCPDCRPAAISGCNFARAKFGF